MRIIAGKFKGRKLIPPTGTDIRPTADRTRESVYNLLMHGQFGGEAIIDQHVVDLCCGTGAFGLEALSRGARIASFIDKDRRSLELARENALHCSTSSTCFFIGADATRLPAPREPAALVFFDPPYDTPILAPSYTSLQQNGWFAPGALLVVEQARNTMIPALDGAEQIDERQYGKAKIVVYRVA